MTSPQQWIHNNDSTAMVPQQCFQSNDSTTMISQQWFQVDAKLFTSSRFLKGSVNAWMCSHETKAYTKVTHTHWSYKPVLQLQCNSYAFTVCAHIRLKQIPKLHTHTKVTYKRILKLQCNSCAFNEGVHMGLKQISKLHTYTKVTNTY